MILLSFFKTTSTVFYLEKCIFFIEIGKFVYFILNTSPIFCWPLLSFLHCFFHVYFGCQTFSISERGKKQKQWWYLMHWKLCVLQTPWWFWSENWISKVLYNIKIITWIRYLQTLLPMPSLFWENVKLFGRNLKPFFLVIGNFL